MDDHSDAPINRGDLMLLLKSYENSISLNTTLLSQQKQLVEKQNQLLQDFHDCKALEKLAEGRSSCKTEHQNVIDKVESGFHGLTIRFILMFGTIVGTLTSILIMIFFKFDKLDKLDAIISMLHQIKGP
jgi:hypothetical protein